MKLFRVFALILVLASVGYAGDIPNVAPSTETTEIAEENQDETQDETTIATILILLEDLLEII